MGNAVVGFLKGAAPAFALAVVFLTLPYIHVFLGLDQLPHAINGLHETKPTLFFAGTFASALLETLFVVGFYFPGSLVLAVLTVSFAGSPFLLMQIGILAWAGFCAGLMLNYEAGSKYSAVVERLGHAEIVDGAKGFSQRYGWIAVIICSWHPNYIGTLFLANGLLGMPRMPLIPLACLSEEFSVAIWIVILRAVGSEMVAPESSYSIWLLGLLFVAGIAMGSYRVFKDNHDRGF